MQQPKLNQGKMEYMTISSQIIDEKPKTSIEHKAYYHQQNTDQGSGLMEDNNGTFDY